MKYLCEIRYAGTDFCGFQVQPQKRTVQGELCRAAEEVFGVPAAVTGCSRTDSGVHALQFFATVEPQNGKLCVPPEKLPIAMNIRLPRDVSVVAARLAEDGFHPRYDAVGKEYVYRIHRSPIADPFLFRRVWQIPRPFLPDALERMSASAFAFEGTHDFAGFMSEGSDAETTVRTVKYCKVEKEGDFYTVRIAADGFLYNMVRIITGTLVWVGLGKILPSDMPHIIASADRKRAGETAPPDGLYLSRVFYPDS